MSDDKHPSWWPAVSLTAHLHSRTEEALSAGIVSIKTSIAEKTNLVKLEFWTGRRMEGVFDTV